MGYAANKQLPQKYNLKFKKIYSNYPHNKIRISNFKGGYSKISVWISNVKVKNFNIKIGND